MPSWPSGGFTRWSRHACELPSESGRGDDGGETDPGKAGEATSTALVDAGALFARDEGPAPSHRGRLARPLTFRVGEAVVEIGRVLGGLALD